MKVYKCIITGDELFTNSYTFEEKDGLYIVRGRYVTRPKGSKVDDSMIGGNASAEEPQEVAADDNTMESGCNVILDNRLLPTGFGTKKEYTAYFKDYVKKLEEIKKETHPDTDFTQWRAEVSAAFKVAVASFKDYEFFTGESSDPGGMIALLKWETPVGEVDEVPFVYYYKAGVKEEKY